jgi:two-component system, OmpR family, response regulator
MQWSNGRPILKIASMSAAMAKRDSSRAKAVVLVVDDDPIVLEIARERLVSAGYEVHTREEALGTSQWVMSHQPDFVLLDINMPALSGAELAMLIRRRETTRTSAIILHSSLPEAELQSLALTTGAIGVVRKTSSDQQFLDEFERAASRHRAPFSS